MVRHEFKAAFRAIADLPWSQLRQLMAGPTPVQAADEAHRIIEERGAVAGNVPARL